MGRSKDMAIHADAANNYFGNDGIIQTNPQTLTENVTVASGVNGLSAGPLTLGDNVTLTINGNLTVV